ncbi:MAG: zf-HC2 domain-containing protein [Acidobacteria bacterium]|nr:zf-HC2 domain-containing protein [Acidobacteriota bacterium]
MRCSKYRTLIYLQESGDATPRQQLKLERHLHTCDGCRDLASSLEPLPLHEVRSELPLENRELEQIRRSVMTGISPAQAGRGSMLRFALITASTLVVLTGAMFIALHQPGEGPGVSEARVTDAPFVESATVSGDRGRRESVTPQNPAAELESAERTDESAPHIQVPAEQEKEAEALLATGAWQPEQEAIDPAPELETKATAVRIELQTSNPNVRIIWIASGRDEASSEPPESTTNT